MPAPKKYVRDLNWKHRVLSDGFRRHLRDSGRTDDEIDTLESRFISELDARVAAEVEPIDKLLELGEALGIRTGVFDSWSTRRFDQGAEEPPHAASLQGGRTAERRQVLEAFATLLDAMHEGLDDPIAAAKPASVAAFLSQVVKGAQTYRQARAKHEDEWARAVLAARLVPDLTRLYEDWKDRWPQPSSPLRTKWVRVKNEKGEQEVKERQLPQPLAPSPAERSALWRQSLGLSRIFRKHGLRLRAPHPGDRSRTVWHGVIDALASPKYYVGMQPGAGLSPGPDPGRRGVGAKHMAQEVAARLTGLSRGKIEHPEGTHVERSAARLPSRFYLADEPQVVSAANVMRAQGAARVARRYYLEYLVQTEAGALGDEEGEDVDFEDLQDRARDRLGIPAACMLASSSMWPSQAELATWNPHAPSPLVRFSELPVAKPFRFFWLPMKYPPAPPPLNGDADPSRARNET